MLSSEYDQAPALSRVLAMRYTSVISGSSARSDSSRSPWYSAAVISCWSVMFLGMNLRRL